MGLDHILFILTVFFMHSELKVVILQCSVFTISHSISLALAASDIFVLGTTVIEPLIALTILFSAIQNIASDKINKGRWLLIFVFGLIHGLGFASALKTNGIPTNKFANSLVAFNIGVEIAQLMVILVAYWSAGRWFSNKIWYKNRIVYPISALTACVAMYWTIMRIQ